MWRLAQSKCQKKGSPTNAVSAGQRGIRKPAKIGARLPVDTTPRVAQDRVMLGETQNQFSLTRVALSTCGRAISTFLSIQFWMLLLLTSGCSDRLDSQDPAQRLRAVSASTDQATLTLIALIDVDPHVRMAATLKIADPTTLKELAMGCVPRMLRLPDNDILRKIIKEGVDPQVRMAAMQKITDQEALKELAMDCFSINDPECNRVGLAAARRLTNQTAFAVVGLLALKNTRQPQVLFLSEVTDQDVLVTAIVGLSDKGEVGLTNNLADWLRDRKRFADIDSRGELMWTHLSEWLTNQEALARLALSGSTFAHTALRSLTDQELLAKVATRSKDINVRFGAINKLTNQIVLADVITAAPQEHFRRAARRRLALLMRPQARDIFEEHDPIRLARILGSISENEEWARLIFQCHGGNTSEVSKDPREVLARIQLAIREPLIRERAPLLVFSSTIVPVSADYHTGIGVTIVGTSVSSVINGESVSTTLRIGRQLVAQQSWKTEFPELISLKAPDFICATASGTKLLTPLLRLPVFQAGDLRSLCGSPIPELREAATLALSERR
jgi:hypothetical protein